MHSFFLPKLAVALIRECNAVCRVQVPESTRRLLVTKHVLGTNPARFSPPGHWQKKLTFYEGILSSCFLFPAHSYSIQLQNINIKEVPRGGFIMNSDHCINKTDVLEKVTILYLLQVVGVTTTRAWYNRGHIDSNYIIVTWRIWSTS